MLGRRWVDALTLGPRRRQRRMMRSLRELDRLDAGLRPGRPARARTAPVYALALVSLTGFGLWQFSNSEFAALLHLDRGQSEAGTSAGEGSFVFLSTQPADPSQPVAYSPCETLHVRVNDAAAPSGADGLVAEAIDETSRLTGLSFEVDGPTDELPNSETSRGRGEPILIAWTDPEQLPALAGDVAGIGGSTAVERSVTRRAWYVSGEIGLDAPDIADILTRPTGRIQARAIIMHELGHVVGLGHVDDPSQLMNAENQGVSEFAAGDRRGLALLGQGTCS